MRGLIQLYHGLFSPFYITWLLLWERFPNRSKRLLVLGSLYGRLTRCSEDDLPQLHAVNLRLNLTQDVHALRFPTLISPWLWRSVHPVERLDQDLTEGYVERLLKRTPCWLYYADNETRRNDLRRLLQLCHQTAQPA